MVDGWVEIGLLLVIQRERRMGSAQMHQVPDVFKQVSAARLIEPAIVYRIGLFASFMSDPAL